MEQGPILSLGNTGGVILTREVIADRLAAGLGRGRRSDAAISAELAAAQSPSPPLDQPPAGLLVPAAVLVPLVDHPEGWTVLLTQRTAHLSNHAGQVSFPGGRIEDEDDDPAAAALRETAEEIGLGADRIELLGRLDDYVTGTGFRISPVVGMVRPPFTLTPDPFEVAETFEVPLAFLMDPANHQRCHRLVQGQSRQYYAMTYQGHYIWGATAGMLVNLYDVLHGPT